MNRDATARAAEGHDEKPDRFIPWQEGLTRIGISRATGYRLIAAGRLPTKRVGKKRFILESTVERILEEGIE
jgi:excisionase family DNA binding protein